jgi:hypothetical protein
MGRAYKHEWGRRGMHIGYWWESQKENQDVGGWTIKWILERQDGMISIGFAWLRIGTSGGLL